MIRANKHDVSRSDYPTANLRSQYPRSAITDRCIPNNTFPAPKFLFRFLISSHHFDGSLSSLSPLLYSPSLSPFLSLPPSLSLFRNFLPGRAYQTEVPERAGENGKQDWIGEQSALSAVFKEKIDLGGGRKKGWGCGESNDRKEIGMGVIVQSRRRRRRWRRRKR